jgi:lysophospholipase L1-like esterase
LRSFAKRALFATIPLALTLLLLEAGLRLFMAPPQVFDVQGLYRNDDVDVVETLHEPDERFIVVTPLGTRLKKNFRAVIHNHRLSWMTTTVQTNSLGYRDEEIGPKAANDFRLLVLGDSITFAEYVPAELTYPAFLQRALAASPHAALAGKRIKAINAGIGHIDLANEYSILMETGLSTRPDVVVVGLYLNDAYRSVSLQVPALPVWLQRSYLVSLVRSRVDSLREEYAYERAQMRLIDELPAVREERERFAATHAIGRSSEEWRSSEAAFNRMILENFIDFGFAWSDRYWEIIEKNVDLFRQARDEHGFDLLFVLLPTSMQVQSELDRSEPQRSFERLMTRMRVEHLDLLPLLRRKFQEDGIDLYYDQCHMNPDGNAFVGRAIADHVVRRILPE